MAVTVRHHAAGNPTTTTATVSVPSTDTGDVVVALDAGNYVGTDQHLASIAGLGATWAKIPGAENQVFSMWVGTAPTPSATARTVTGTGADLSSSNGTTARYLTVFVLSGTRNLYASVSALQNGGTVTSPPIDADKGQMVIGAGYSNTSAGAISGTSPADGWTMRGSRQIANDGSTDGERWAVTASRAPGAPSAHTVSAARTSGTVSTMVLVVGEVPAPGTVKVMTGHEWVAKPVKRWDGTAWVDSPVRRWNGTAWV